MRDMKRYIVVPALVGLILTNCGSDSTTDVGTAATTSTIPSTLPSVPAGPFDECGEYEISFAEPGVGAEARAAQECFRAALEAGRTARLTVIAPTDEGDPVAFTYTVVGANRLHVHENASEDAFGPPYVRERTCRSFEPSTDSVPQTADCTEATTVFLDS